MIERLKNRITQSEQQGGFTLIELLVVVIIIGILLAIAVPSYLNFRDNAQKKAAQSNVRAVIPAVENYQAENTGAAGDADNSATTSGYQGMTPTLLRNYDQSIDATKYTVSNLAVNDYCVRTSEGKYTAWKRGPAGAVKVDLTSNASAICT